MESSKTRICRDGEFCWDELLTTDPAAARDFLVRLFGWTDRSAGMPDMDYRLLGVGDAMVAGLMELPPEVAAQGIPSHWDAYVKVADVDAAIARATELGAEVLLGTKAIPGVGRIAVVRSPSKEVLSLFEYLPERSGQPEPDLAEVPGGIAWRELYTRDLDSSKAFYAGLFGWTATTEDRGMGPYTIFLLDGWPVAGAIAMDDSAGWDGIPACWGRYVTVADLDATLDEVRRSGGHVHHDPCDIPGFGRIGFLSDPTGAVLSLVQRS